MSAATVLRSSAGFVGLPFRTAWRLARKGLVLFASLFGTNLATARDRYKRLILAYLLIYILQAIPLFRYWSLSLVAVGFIGVLAVNQAWYENERIRGEIVRGQTNGDLLTFPNLRWFSLLTAVQLFVLFPLIFFQCHELFALFTVPDNASWTTWVALTFDGFCKSMLDWSEVYGIHFSQIEYSTMWGRHLVMTKRLTFDYILIRGIISTYGLTDKLINEAVAVLRSNHMFSVRLGKAIVPSLIETLTHKDSVVRANAAKALGEIGDRRGVPSLILKVTDTHSNVQVQAIRALAALRDESALDQIISVLQKDNATKSVKGEAALTLGLFGAPSSLLPLTEALNDTASSVRVKAAKSLGMLNTPDAVRPLVHAALMDQVADVRNAARSALAALDDHESVTSLIIESLNDTASLVRCHAADALGSLGDLAALEPLVHAAITDEQEEVRVSATEALRNLDDERVVELILDALTDNQVNTAVRVAETLGLLGTAHPRAMEELYRLKNHPMPTVSTAAQVAIDSLNSTKPPGAGS